MNYNTEFTYTFNPAWPPYVPDPAEDLDVIRLTDVDTVKFAIANVDEARCGASKSKQTETVTMEGEHIRTYPGSLTVISPLTFNITFCCPRYEYAGQEPTFGEDIYEQSEYGPFSFSTSELSVVPSDCSLTEQVIINLRINEIDEVPPDLSQSSQLIDDLWELSTQTTTGHVEYELKLKPKAAHAETT